MRKEFVIPTTLSYDIKLEDWEMKQRYSSGRVRSAGDFKFWKIVFEETDALIAKGGDKDVSILPNNLLYYYRNASKKYNSESGKHTGKNSFRRDGKLK